MYKIQKSGLLTMTQHTYFNHIEGRPPFQVYASVENILDTCKHTWES